MSENGTKFDEAEALAAILAEMSDGIHTGRADIIDAVNERLLAYAGRIKAAVKREREEVTAARHAFVGVDFAKDKPTYTCVEIAPGNAAAMREALERLDEHLHEDDYDGHLFFNLFDYDPKEEIRAALSAPARNCDWFQTADEARDAVKAAFANTMLLDDRQLRAVCDWLFDSAEGGAE